MLECGGDAVGLGKFLRGGPDKRLLALSYVPGGGCGKDHLKAVHLPFDMREDVARVRQLMEFLDGKSVCMEMGSDFFCREVSFEMREFPESGEQPFGRAFAQGKRLSCAQQQHCQVFLAALLFLLLDGQFLFAACIMRETE